MRIKDKKGLSDSESQYLDFLSFLEEDVQVVKMIKYLSELRVASFGISNMESDGVLCGGHEDTLNNTVYGVEDEITDKLEEKYNIGLDKRARDLWDLFFFEIQGYGENLDIGKLASLIDEELKPYLARLDEEIKSKKDGGPCE